MQIIEEYVKEVRSTGSLAGLPEQGVVEDDAGLRWFVTEFPLPVGVWQRAVEQNALEGVLTSDGMILSAQVSLLPVSNGMMYSLGIDATSNSGASRYVHLHAHSEYSQLDGLSKISEMVHQAGVNQQGYLAIADHGVCAGHLELQRECKDTDVKPLFGLEAYLVDDARVKDPKNMWGYWHFVIFAKTQQGLLNLWRASTLAGQPEHFYQKPRLDWRILEECREGLVATTACLRGPLAETILRGDETKARQDISRMRAIFQDDLYLELHTNNVDKMSGKEGDEDRYRLSQHQLNEGLVSLGRDTGTGLVLVSDSHYSCKEHREDHEVWMAVQTRKTLDDEADLFSDHQDYHLHSESEARDSIDYLPSDVIDEAIDNTLSIAQQCDVTINPMGGTPVYHRNHQVGSETQQVEKDEEVMDRLCREAWEERLGEQAGDPAYEARYQEELALITDKGYCGYHLIVWDYMNWCRDNSILTGPGRGSAAGSIVCYLLGITQIDPIEAGLLFERYISPGRTELPDIDSDFPTSSRTAVIDYIVERWGAEHVVRVGTITRLRNKGVFDSVNRVFQDTEHAILFEHMKEIKGIIDAAEAGTAGLGLSWDELWTQEGELLQPFKDEYPQVFRFCETLVGRLKSYGKHPAGVVIDPINNILDLLPLRQGEEEDHPVTEFPMEQLDALKLVKFDILTLRTLDTIQECMRLIEADPRLAGKVRHPHKWKEEYRDPMVWDMLCEGETLGVFQVETKAVSRLTDRLQPRNLADLCAILTLVRPGPMRSGLTDSYIRRRHGEEHVTYDHPLLEDVLQNTYGTMVYQEDIMNIVKVIAGYTSAEADEVRKILGKKKVDMIVAEGERFRARSTQMGIDPSISERMFNQMEEFARYSFNKSHSWAYAMLGYWCAWFKAHFPVHFVVACLSTADQDRFPEFVQYARRSGFRIETPDVNESEMTFSITPDLMGIRYGLSSINGVGEAAASGIIPHRPFLTWDDFVERKGGKCNWGHVKKLAYVGGLDTLLPEGHSRLDLEGVIDQIENGKIEICAHNKPGFVPGTTPSEEACDFDWLSEPVEIGKSGKPKKRRPPPKRCNKACRQYTPVSNVHWPSLGDIHDRDRRNRELEVFGLYVTSTPFDGLDVGEVATMDDLSHGDINFNYYVAAEVVTVRKRQDRFGNDYAFVTLMLPDGNTDAIIFNKQFDQYRKILKPRQLALFVINKNNRGFNIVQMHPLNT